MILRGKSVFIHLFSSFLSTTSSWCLQMTYFLFCFSPNSIIITPPITLPSPRSWAAYLSFMIAFWVHLGKVKSACQISRSWGLMNDNALMKQVGRTGRCPVGMPQGFLVMAALIPLPSVFSGGLAQGPVSFRFCHTCWTWELTWHISPQAIIQRMRVVLGGLCLSAKRSTFMCPPVFAPLPLPRRQFIYRPWRRLRPVPENLANIPFSSQLFFSLFPSCLVELPGSSRHEEQMLRDGWFGAGVGKISLEKKNVNSKH